VPYIKITLEEMFSSVLKTAKSGKAAYTGYTQVNPPGSALNEGGSSGFFKIFRGF
jgi:hypothetical protein